MGGGNPTQLMPMLHDLYIFIRIFDLPIFVCTMIGAGMAWEWVKTEWRKP